MTNLYIDQDGVLARWCDAPLEEVKKEGYFLSRELETVMKEVVDILSACTKVRVYLLSSVWDDGHSASEKRRWIKDKGVRINDEDILFVPYGMSKSEFIRRNKGAHSSDILLDDYSLNLRQWHGVGIKFMNGVNGTKGTWKSYRVDHGMSAKDIAERILRLA